MKMFKSYAKPTPKKLRKLGDAILIVGVTVDGYAMASDYPVVGFISMLCGVVGKFLTNFFAEEE